MSIETAIKQLALRFGIDIRRAHNATEFTLLGLRNQPFGTVLDVGANRGQFARVALEAFPVATIHCFEPLPEPYAQLAAWTNRVPDGRVLTYHTALGEAVTELAMYEHVGHTASSSLLARTQLATEMFPQTQATMVRRVPVTTLDNWLRDHAERIADPVLLKIDVQGYEAQVLRGAKASLPGIDTCIIEVSTVPLYDGQAGFDELVRLLAIAGLAYVGNLAQVHARDGRALFLDAVFRRIRRV